jgi:hypothetical protein
LDDIASKKTTDEDLMPDVEAKEISGNAYSIEVYMLIFMYLNINVYKRMNI